MAILYVSYLIYQVKGQRPSQNVKMLHIHRRLVTSLKIEKT